MQKSLLTLVRQENIILTFFDDGKKDIALRKIRQEAVMQSVAAGVRS